MHINESFKFTADLENMTSAERITILQEKLQEIRKHYLSLKSEVASIDRRRKRLKKKERESKCFYLIYLNTKEFWLDSWAHVNCVCDSSGNNCSGLFSSSIKSKNFI